MLSRGAGGWELMKSGFGCIELVSRECRWNISSTNTTARLKSKKKTIGWALI